LTLSISLNPEFTFIRSDADLQRYVERWRSLDNIFIDTEFMRSNTFYPKPALIQVAAGGDYFLIDPLTIKDPEPFAELLIDPSVVKVMHACSEDMELFHTYLGVLPTPLFDTQIGASFLGYGLSVGYKNLVATLFDIDLPKGEQRSNWLRRPLTEQQLAYAVTDVTFLVEIYHSQMAQLNEAGRLAWVLEECANTVSSLNFDAPGKLAYQRVKNGFKLTPDELIVMQALAEWREQEARAKDIPRGFLLKDDQMIELAQLQPQSITGFLEISELSRRIRADGDKVLAIIERAMSSTIEIDPVTGPLPPAAKSLVKKLQAKVSKIASEHDVAPQLLMNRKTLVKVIHNVINEGTISLPVELSSWKKVLLGDAILTLLEQHKESLQP